MLRTEVHDSLSMSFCGRRPCEAHASEESPGDASYLSMTLHLSFCNLFISSCSRRLCVANVSEESQKMLSLRSMTMYICHWCSRRPCDRQRYLRGYLIKESKMLSLLHRTIIEIKVKKRSVSVSLTSSPSLCVCK